MKCGHGGGCWKSVEERRWQMKRCWCIQERKLRAYWKQIWHKKHRWVGHVLRHKNFLHDIIEGKVVDKTARDGKRMELLQDIQQQPQQPFIGKMRQMHIELFNIQAQWTIWRYDMMEGRYYGQLKDLISDRSRWRQDSKWEGMSETCWKQQKTKEVVSV